MKRTNPGFQVDRANLRGYCTPRIASLVKLLVKNEILRRNSYCISVEFSTVFGCKSSEMLFFLFLMIQEHTKIHFRTITGVLIPKSENRIFLNKLASEDPFKGCPRRGTSFGKKKNFFSHFLKLLKNFFKINIFCSNFQDRQIRS